MNGTNLQRTDSPHHHSDDGGGVEEIECMHPASCIFQVCSRMQIRRYVAQSVQLKIKLQNILEKAFRILQSALHHQIKA